MTQTLRLSHHRSIDHIDLGSSLVVQVLAHGTTVGLRRLGNGSYLIDRISFNPDALSLCDFNALRKPAHP